MTTLKTISILITALPLFSKWVTGYPKVYIFSDYAEDTFCKDNDPILVFVYRSLISIVVIFAIYIIVAVAFAYIWGTFREPYHLEY